MSDSTDSASAFAPFSTDRTATWHANPPEVVNTDGLGPVGSGNAASLSWKATPLATLNKDATTAGPPVAVNPPGIQEAETPADRARRARARTLELNAGIGLVALPDVAGPVALTDGMVSSPGPDRAAAIERVETPADRARRARLNTPGWPPRGIIAAPSAPPGGDEELDGLETQIRTKIEGLGNLLRSALDRKLELGRLLLEAKDLCKADGKRWLPFLERCGIAERSASEAMSFSTNEEAIERLRRHGGADLTITAVRKALSKPKARSKVVDRVPEQGDVVEMSDLGPPLARDADGGPADEIPTVVEVAAGSDRRLRFDNEELAPSTTSPEQTDGAGDGTVLGPREVVGELGHAGGLFERCGTVVDGLNEAIDGLESGDDARDAFELERIFRLLVPVVERLRSVVLSPGRAEVFAGTEEGSVGDRPVISSPLRR